MTENRTALLLVDAQRNMLEGDDAVPDADAITKRLRALLERARDSAAVVVHVQNDGPPDSPDESGTPGWELLWAPGDGEEVVRKDQPDAFAADVGLAGRLSAQGVDRLVIAGMQSEYCAQASCRGALAAGFEVALAADADATYDDGLRTAAEPA
ncbi:MAG: isochorismatase family protein [Mycobacteriales bacterium]